MANHKTRRPLVRRFAKAVGAVLLLLLFPEAARSSWAPASPRSSVPIPPQKRNHRHRPSCHAAKRRLLARSLSDTASSPSSPLPAVESASVYDHPELYDLAFGYRDFDGEVDFLLRVHGLAQQQERRSTTLCPALPAVLELAAGPARHGAAALLSGGAVGSPRVRHVTAVDLSEAMRDYALDLWREELKAEEDEDEVGEDPVGAPRLRYVVQDMRDTLPLPPTAGPDGPAHDGYDTAWLLLGSLQHLLTTDDVLQCFRSTRDALMPGGTLIVELPHPQEVFKAVDCTRNTWRILLDNRDSPLADEDDEEDDSQKALVVVWGDQDDPFDPVRQVRDATVEFRLRGCSDADLPHLGIDGPTLRQIVPTRLFTAPELDALARCAGFRVQAMYGALDPDVLVAIDNDDDDLAYRMVCVLQKV